MRSVVDKLIFDNFIVLLYLQVNPCQNDSFQLVKMKQLVKSNRLIELQKTFLTLSLSNDNNVLKDISLLACTLMKIL